MHTINDLRIDGNLHGDFEAFVDGKMFYSDAGYYKEWPGHFFIGGTSNENFVIFSVPTSLVGDGPHDVELYDSPGMVKWEVGINSERSDVKAGSTTVTFANDRNNAKGTFDFVLENGKKVTGAYLLFMR
jgi:hypothetical protein